MQTRLPHLLLLALLVSLPLQAFAQRTKVNPKDGATMIYIPAGEFIRGNDKGFIAEKPQRKIYLDGYWIYKHEVTVAQYKKFCAATQRKMPSPPSWGWVDTHPMVKVTWKDATDYLRWAEAVLPTEAQWEKAARGTDGREYPWGNNTENLANKANYGNKLKQPSEVGSYPHGASPYQVLDMAGNVAEWCQDWFQEKYYKDAPLSNPPGPRQGTARVTRGGSWNTDISYGRSARRSGSMPYNLYLTVGFRGVMPD